MPGITGSNRLDVLLVGASFVVIIVIGSILFRFLFETDQDREQRRTTERLEYAYTVTRDYVRSQLKAPATATFSSFRESSVTKDDSIVSVGVWVDSENSFGARLRSHFVAVWKDSAGRIWMKGFREVR